MEQLSHHAQALQGRACSTLLHLRAWPHVLLQAPVLWDVLHPHGSWVWASFLMPWKEVRAQGWRPAHLQFSTGAYTVFLRPLNCVSSNPGLPHSGHVPNAARQIHFEVGVLLLLQQAVQEEECFPLMFISCEHCRPRLELISCVVLCKNRKYVLPTFQMLWNAEFGGKENDKWEKYGTSSFPERSPNCKTSPVCVKLKWFTVTAMLQQRLSWYFSPSFADIGDAYGYFFCSVLGS